MRREKAYYSVFTLKDGTVLLARPTRKPAPKVLKQWMKVIDDDGVWREFVESEKDLDNYNAEAMRTVEAVAAGALNTRRVIRLLVLPRLEQIEGRLTAVGAQLDRIEAALRTRAAGMEGGQ